MTKQRLKDYCEAEFENIDVVLGIISSELCSTLSNHLSFRHFFVHVYSFNLKWEDLKVLIDSLKDTLETFRQAVLCYIDRMDLN